MTLAQKSDRILAQTRGLSGATPNATQLIEELRWALEAYRQENARLTAERDEARREICTNEANDLAYDLERKGVFGITGKSMAEKRGWNCFTEDGK
jgi:hypothetical protein